MHEQAFKLRLLENISHTLTSLRLCAQCFPLCRNSARKRKFLILNKLYIHLHGPKKAMSMNSETFGCYQYSVIAKTILRIIVQSRTPFELTPTRDGYGFFFGRLMPLR